MKLSSSSTPVECTIATPEVRLATRRGISHLLGINAVSFAFSVINEVVIGHSALGFTQMTMEATDSGLAKGLHYTEANDAAGRHRRASRQRQALYGVHIATASLGVAEGIRLMQQGSEPSVRNIVVSGIVGAINAHFLYHLKQHKKHIAHTETPTIETAFSDPIEVAQDVAAGFPNNEAVHQMNSNGTTAITYTNLAESAGGMVGAAAQYGWEQGSSVAAIVSSIAVIGIMGRQIARERSIIMPPQTAI